MGMPYGFSGSMRKAYTFVQKALSACRQNGYRRERPWNIPTISADHKFAILRLDSLCRCTSFTLWSCRKTPFPIHVRTYKKESDKNDNAVKIARIMTDRSPRDLRVRQILNARQQKLKKGVQEAFHDRRAKLSRTGKQIRAKGKLLIDDFKKTKNKMKEKMEEVIERENVYTIPNLLCVTRIVFSPLLGYFIVHENFDYALTFMAIAGVSDWVDGYIARNYASQSSKIGSFLDPMADKVLIGTLFLCLTYVGLIPVQLTVLIIARDIVLVIAGVVIRYRSLPSPRTLSRYFDVSLATAQLAPTFVSKVNTGVQLILVASTLAAPVFGYVDHAILHALWYVTTISTLVSAGSYALSKETYRYLKDEKRSKRN